MQRTTIQVDISAVRRHADPIHLGMQFAEYPRGDLACRSVRAVNHQAEGKIARNGPDQIVRIEIVETPIYLKSLRQRLFVRGKPIRYPLLELQLDLIGQLVAGMPDYLQTVVVIGIVRG